MQSKSLQEERRKNHQRLVSVIEPSTFSLYDENTSVGVVEPLIFAVYDDAQVYAEHQALYLETQWQLCFAPAVGLVFGPLAKSPGLPKTPQEICSAQHAH